jgi:hypothetical protein
MSGMYDEPKVSDVKLKPYPHEERGTGKVGHKSQNLYKQKIKIF